jgi:hypothetical protein
MNENTYSTVKHASIGDRAAYNARLRMYRALSGEVDLQSVANILDVGVTADKENISSNFFENIYPYPGRITALSDQDASWMEEKYEGLKFVKGDALRMPFANGSFDLVFSSAVIEHVGSAENQAKFVKECCRVARRYVFITTPNRYYPMELHTALPFIHWLPKPIHRRILRLVGNDYLAREENLNLLTKAGIKRICAENAGWRDKITTVKFLGFPSNILLFMEK